MVGRGKVSVLILHPDFDQAGKLGIKAAQEYAERMVEGAREIGKQAVEAGDVTEIDIRKYLSGFRYVVRRVPDDLL